VGSLKPYYSDEKYNIKLYLGNCFDILPEILTDEHVFVVDPPYGIDLKGLGHSPVYKHTKIAGDATTDARDWLISIGGTRCMAIFGSPRISRPGASDGISEYNVPPPRATLIWSKGGHTGMGNLKFPWKPDYEEIYIYGDKWEGERTTSVLCYNAIGSAAGKKNGRWHPTQKPESLMMSLIGKAPKDCIILDPFAGSFSTIVAAKKLGYAAVGIELEEVYLKAAVTRLQQEVMLFDIPEKQTSFVDMV